MPTASSGPCDSAISGKRLPLFRKSVGVVTLLKIGCGFVGIRGYNHGSGKNPGGYAARLIAPARNRPSITAALA